MKSEVTIKVCPKMKPQKDFDLEMFPGPIDGTIEDLYSLVHKRAKEDGWFWQNWHNSIIYYHEDQSLHIPLLSISEKFQLQAEAYLQKTYDSGYQMRNVNLDVPGNDLLSIWIMQAIIEEAGGDFELFAKDITVKFHRMSTGDSLWSRLFLDTTTPFRQYNLLGGKL